MELQAVDTDFQFQASHVLPRLFCQLFSTQLQPVSDHHVHSGSSLSHGGGGKEVFALHHSYRRFAVFLSYRTLFIPSAGSFAMREIPVFDTFKSVLTCNFNY